MDRAVGTGRGRSTSRVAAMRESTLQVRAGVEVVVHARGRRLEAGGPPTSRVQQSTETPLRAIRCQHQPLLRKERPQFPQRPRVSSNQRSEQPPEVVVWNAACTVLGPARRGTCFIVNTVAGQRREPAQASGYGCDGG
jgi:hypothetical protein